MPGKRVSIKISDIKWRLSIISPFAESIIIFRHIKTIVNRRLVSRFRKKTVFKFEKVLRPVSL